MKTSKRETFFGTFYNKNTIIRISKIAELFAWVILIFYATQFIFQMGMLFSQVARGFWIGLSFIDVAQNILWLLEQPLRGLVYFVVLLGVAQIILMIMDIENNTRMKEKSNINNHT